MTDSATDSFWNRFDAGKAAGGLFNVGAGLYGRNAGANEAARRLRTAQGPLYDAQMQGAQTAMTRAGSMDPRALGQERYNAEQGLLAGKDASDEAAILRRLQAQGMLGAETYNPGIKGVTPNGTPMNPQLAAYYATKQGRDATMAAGSLDAGNKDLDMMLQRGGMLQGQAANTQAAGLTAMGKTPSRSGANMEILKALSSVGKDSGLFGMGANWLRNQFGGGGVPSWGLSGGGGQDWSGF